jgi:hypothetical protein
MAHSEREHSIYSPSAWERWSTCPGSAKLTADMPEETSEHAERGTWMHEQVENVLLGRDVSGPESVWDTTDNWIAINQVVDYVRALIDRCSVIEPAKVWYEDRLELGAGYDDVFGTGDLRIFDHSENRLYVVDYKFGHTLVKAKDNGQLLMYASMAMNNMYWPVGVVKPDFITMIILQPASPALVNEWTIDRDYLWEWINNELYPAISAAEAENAPFVPSASACKYCPASGDCPAQTQQSIEVFEKFDVVQADVQHYPDLLPQLETMEEFIKGVRKQALKALLDGAKIPGYKLVKSTTKRKWADEEKAEKWLAARKIPKDQRTVTKVVGIQAAEKLLKGVLNDNPRLQNNFGKLIHKPEGHPIMAREDDNRAEVTVTNPLLNGDMI